MAVTALVGTGSETSVAPPAHTDDDWLVLLVETTSGTVTTPAGWTPRGSIPAAAGTTSGFVFVRKVGVGETVGNAALAGGSNHLWGVIVRLRGADPTTPFAAIAFAYATAATTTGFTPSVFVESTQGKFAVMAMGWALDNAGPLASAWANASLTNVTEIYDAGTVTNDGGGITIATGDLSGGGPALVGPGTATLTSTMAIGLMIVVNAAPATPTHTISGTITIDGVPAANGTTVEIWDKSLGVRETSTVVAGGAGGYSAGVREIAHNYFATYDDGSSRGISPTAVPES